MNAFKQQCIELRKKDYTLTEIMQVTGKGKSTIYFHIKDIPLSKKKRKEISENSKQLALKIAGLRRGKALRPHKPFSKWSPHLVLLVAHMIFDGELKKSAIYHNRSGVLTERVTALMKLVYDFEPKRELNKVTDVNRVSYHNVALSNHLKEKSKELKEQILNMSAPCRRAFLRAFFDDEGCMDFRPARSHRRVRGYQKDRSILLLVQKLLESFDIESFIKEPNEVVIIGKENLKRFQKEINFSKGVRINGKRTNSTWKKNLEKRVLLDMAIKSFKT